MEYSRHAAHDPYGNYGAVTQTREASQGGQLVPVQPAVYVQEVAPVAVKAAPVVYRQPVAVKAAPVVYREPLPAPVVYSEPIAYKQPLVYDAHGGYGPAYPPHGGYYHEGY